jgi:hypothetical protein
VLRLAVAQDLLGGGVDRSGVARFRNNAISATLREDHPNCTRCAGSAIYRCVCPDASELMKVADGSAAGVLSAGCCVSTRQRRLVHCTADKRRCAMCVLPGLQVHGPSPSRGLLPRLDQGAPSASCSLICGCGPVWVHLTCLATKSTLSQSAP